MSTDQDVLLTRPEVERRTGLSRSTLYRKMREGTFPVPLKVSEWGQPPVVVRRSFLLPSRSFPLMPAVHERFAPFVENNSRNTNRSCIRLTSGEKKEQPR